MNQVFIQAIMRRLRKQQPELIETTDPQDRPQDTLAFVIFWAIVVIFVIGILIA